MSSAPETDDASRVTVKRVPGGRGLELAPRPRGRRRRPRADPAGRRVLPARRRPPGRRVLRRQRRHPGDVDRQAACCATTDRPVRILYANRDARSVIFERDLAELAAAHPGPLRAPPPPRRRRRLPRRRRRRRVPRRPSPTPTSTSAVPAPFMDLVESTLLGSRRRRRPDPHRALRGRRPADGASAAEAPRSADAADGRTCRRVGDR